jgi:hypothetical protein
MTRRINPLSVQDAWMETGRLLGWEYLTQAICSERLPEAGRVTVKTVQGWCNADKWPPVWALHIGDRLLKGTGHPMLNFAAYRAAVGDISINAGEHLTEIRHQLKIAVRLVEGSIDETWSFHEIIAKIQALQSDVNAVQRQLNELMHHVCLRHDRWRADRRARAEDRLPRDSGERPWLRQVGGIDDE